MHTRLMRMGLILASLCTTPASAVVIDFDGLSGSGINFNRGFTYTEDGFVLDSLATSDEFASVHPGDFRYFGSVHFYNNAPNGITRLTEDGGGVFSLDSIDLNSLNGDYAVTVTFAGQKSGGGTAVQSFTTDALAGFETFFFSGDFDNVIEVSWIQADPFHYFDNIGVNVVPEPTNFLLFLLGIAGMVPFARRFGGPLTHSRGQRSDGSHREHALSGRGDR